MKTEEQNEQPANVISDMITLMSAGLSAVKTTLGDEQAAKLFQSYIKGREYLFQLQKNGGAI